MRLSEAMRLGSMVVPPIRGPIFDRTGGVICGACAIGAAMYAAGSEEDRTRWMSYCLVSDAESFWPWTRRRIAHPIRSEDYWDVLGIVIDLFEEYGWSREQIADWVESVEAAQASEASQSADAVARTVDEGTVPQRAQEAFAVSEGAGLHLSVADAPENRKCKSTTNEEIFRAVTGMRYSSDLLPQRAERR